MPLADLRKDYTLAGLTEKDLARDPFRQFEKWFQEAEASAQGTVIGRGKALEDAFKAVEKKYAGKPVPLAPHWGGWGLAPEAVEFWQGRRSRLHGRLRYRREADGWTVERLSP